ncbi:MAG: hypothetical protein QXK43_01155 [Candidatus Jordarchaeales archaeon]
MMAKEENIKKMIEMLDKAWEVTPSIIIYTEDYVYTLFPIDDKKERWQEVSFTIPDGSIEIRELTTKDALIYLMEEITKGLPNYVKIPVVTELNELNEIKEKIKKMA